MFQQASSMPAIAVRMAAFSPRTRLQLADRPASRFRRRGPQRDDFAAVVADKGFDVLSFFVC